MFFLVSGILVTPVKQLGSQKSSLPSLSEVNSVYFSVILVLCEDVDGIAGMHKAK